MNKRILAMLMVLCMAVSLLSACGSKSAETEAPATTAATSATSAPETLAPTEPEGPKHVDVLRIGTTYANDTFSVFSQNGAFGRMNYNSFVNLTFWAFDENNQLSTQGCFFFRTFDFSFVVKIMREKNSTSFSAQTKPSGESMRPAQR